ncbi:MAG: hypothetical protein KF841_07465 [Phycisphaerae bacterium]|nr:hypothetical protein [Phycisphaerae bacterium]
MYQDGSTMVVNKRLSFLSVTVLSLSAILITLIVSATGLAVYGLRVVDKRVDSVADVLVEAVRQLPEFQKSLPPALADTLNDSRQPAYASKLEVSVKLLNSDSRSGNQNAVAEVKNLGESVVSLLSLRLVGLNEGDEPILERNTWAATPLQLEGEWRGPIMPHETRQIPIRLYSQRNLSKITHEITDIRVWRGPQPDSSLSRTAPSSVSDAS